MRDIIESLGKFNPDELDYITERLEQAIENEQEALKYLRQIESMDQEIKNDRAELERIYRESSDPTENAVLIDKSLELDKKAFDFQGLKADFVKRYGKKMTSEANAILSFNFLLHSRRKDHCRNHYRRAQK